MFVPHTFHRTVLRVCLAIAVHGLTTASLAWAATTPAELLSGYTRQSGSAPDPSRGKALFTASHGQTLSCAACHGESPLAAGKHATTGKVIGPLAPGANAERFTDAARAEKWFRRNCREVLDRECTAAEKANVLSWLIQLKP